MDWKYVTNMEMLDRGAWLSSIGMVELERPEMAYRAWVYLQGKRVKVVDPMSGNGLWESAEAAIAAVERVYKKQTEEKKR